MKEKLNEKRIINKDRHDENGKHNETLKAGARFLVDKYISRDAVIMRMKENKHFIS